MSCQFCSTTVSGKTSVRFSTGKVSRGVVDPQCIVVRRFLDTDEWWCELLRYNFATPPKAPRGSTWNIEISLERGLIYQTYLSTQAAVPEAGAWLP